MNYLYVIPIPQESIFKIGITTNLEQRLIAHQTNWRAKLGVFDKSTVQYIKSTSAGKIDTLEKDLKYKFEQYLVGIDVSGHTEIYNLACIDLLIEELNRQADMYRLNALEAYEVKTVNYTQAPYPTKEEREVKKKTKRQTVDVENREKINQFINDFNCSKHEFELFRNTNYSFGFKINREFDSSGLFNKYCDRFHLILSFPDGTGGYCCLEGTEFAHNSETSGEGDIHFIKGGFVQIMKYYPELWDQMPIEIKSNL